MKLATPQAELIAQGMTWAERLPSGIQYVIGGAEVLGAIGLILPSALGILPKLTPAAAAGLVTVMVLAAIDHGVAGEMGAIVPPLVLGAMAAFVAWGRLSGAPIDAR